MEQLSGTDSYFLYTERGNVYNHVAALGIYDPSTAPGGHVRFKDILGHFSRRLHMHKLFRRRLVTVPQGLDRPYWVDDPAVDLEFHVRHIALPDPGDWRQLMIQVARIHSRPLDRSRPLWEIYVIEGLDRIRGLPAGSFAVLQKFHHACVDGVAGGKLIAAVHTTSPDPDPAQVGAETLYGERDPSAIELYSRAAASGVGRAANISSLYVKTLRRISGVVAGQVATGAGLGKGDDAPALPAFKRAPVTRFNTTVSANRVVEAVALPLAEMKRARAKLPEATINDFFLAVVGGALRTYLQSKRELPAQSLIALMPMSLRTDGQAAVPGNQVGGVPTPVRSDIADPVERLRACHRDARAVMRGADALGRDFLKNVLDELPHAVSDAFMRHYVFPQLNVTVSNVRGPEATLYLAGARLVHLYPINIATDHIGLTHTCFSYDGVMWLSAVACRNMMPDPAFYAQCLRESFADLIAALEALPAPRGGASRKPARRRRVAAAGK